MQTASTLHIFLLNPQKAGPCLVWAKDEETAKRDAASLTGGLSGKNIGEKGFADKSTKNLGDKNLGEKSFSPKDRQMKSGSDIGGKTECQCKELQFNKDYKVTQELGSDRVEIEYRNQKIRLAKDIATPIH